MKLLGRFVHSLFAGFVILAIPGAVFAAPAVSSISGTVAHGQSVTISGSGFGAKPTASPVLWDTVDNIASYASLANGATIPVGGSNPWPSPYGNSSGNGYVKLNTSDAQRGKSAKQYKATSQRGAYLDGLTWTATNSAYVSWWWKTNTNVSSGEHSSKFLRMSNSSDEVNKTFSWTQQQNYVYSSPNYCSNSWNGWNGNPNNWNFLEAWFNSANRTYTLRVNGVALANNVSWASCGSFSFNELWKIGFDGGGTAPPAITWWMDDIYVDSSFARVMIGNASTYSGSTTFEMQIPRTTWNDGQIQIVVNQGGFADGATAYLYVIDASGNVSAGKQVTFGSSSGGGTIKVPSAPQAY